jgi:hypothetical protein
MNMLIKLLYCLLGAFLAIALIVLCAYSGPNTTVVDSLEKQALQADSLIGPVQQVRAPAFPQNIHFAGEYLPADNFDARERLDREILANSFRHSATFLYLKRAHRYFPIIEAILKKEGVPDDIKYLSVAESGLSNAVSPAGARGFWQFMPSTARDRGLEVSTEVDERYHLEKSTLAACKYLKDAHKTLGSWSLAAAAYNMGKAGLQKSLRAQAAQNYFDLNLNAETARYLFRIMALKEIMQHPQKYGYHLVPQDYYQALPAYKIVEEKGSISDFAAYTKQHKISYRMLKLYNPWLRRTSLTNKYKKTYKIKIPIL